MMKQSFPMVRGGVGGIGNFTEGGGYRVKETWGGVILKIQTFLWKMNIKLKINMTCVSKSMTCVSKSKNGAGAMTTAKNAVFIGL